MADRAAADLAIHAPEEAAHRPIARAFVRVHFGQTGESARQKKNENGEKAKCVHMPALPKMSQRTHAHSDTHAHLVTHTHRRASRGSEERAHGGTDGEEDVRCITPWVGEWPYPNVKLHVLILHSFDIEADRWNRRYSCPKLQLVKNCCKEWNKAAWSNWLLRQEKKIMENPSVHDDWGRRVRTCLSRCIQS